VTTGARRQRTGAIYLAPQRAHPALLFHSLAVRASEMRWVAGVPPHGMTVPPLRGEGAPQAGAGGIGGGRGRAATPEHPPPHPHAAGGVPVLYRIRHMQGLVPATAQLMRRRDYEEGHTILGGLGGWRLHDLPRVGNTPGRPGRGAPADPNELLVVVWFDPPQRAVCPGQSVVLYEAPPPPPHDVLDERCAPDAAPAADAGKQQPGSAAAADEAVVAVEGGREAGGQVEEVVEDWVFAGQRCYGSGVILAAGPSMWDRGLETPETWIE
jgi:hypothetical protein